MKILFQKKSSKGGWTELWKLAAFIIPVMFFILVFHTWSWDLLLISPNLALIILQGLKAWKIRRNKET